MAATVFAPFDDERSGEGEASGSPAARPDAASAYDLPPQDLAVSVTRQVQITGPREWKHLLSGVDSLDLGLYVEWSGRWVELERELASAKELAVGTQGIRWKGAPHDQCLILPGGKPPMYAFHLLTPHFHMFISRRQRGTKYPNVYVSPLASSLWLEGVRPTIARIVDFIIALGGDVQRMQVSRCDLCADFLIPGGLSLDWLRALMISRARAWRPFMSGEALQTLYVGGNGSVLQCRIYDKGLEVASDGIKSWFLQLWGIESLVDVWRVEFQIRRQVLKEFRVEDLDDLISRSGGIWEALTSSWLSFRLQDDTNCARRTVHPWWQTVQECSRDFGSQIAIARNHDSPNTALVDWYIAHGAGCLAGYAARLGIGCLDEALRRFEKDATEYWAVKDFAERYRRERIRLGFDDSAAADQGT